MVSEKLDHHTLDTGSGFGFFRGRVALAAILRACGIGAGDLVMQQAFTCSAVIEGVYAVGAKPLFVDVGEQSLNLDPSALPANPPQNLRAIIVQHSFGIPADMDPILAYAAAHDLWVIEDCCHAIGSRYKGRRVGKFGDAAFYSFEFGKPIVAGLGGWALANDQTLLERLGEEYSSYSEPQFRQQIWLEAMCRAYRMFYSPSTYWAVRDAYRLAIRLRMFNYAHISATSLNFGQPTSDFAYRLGRLQRWRLETELRRFDEALAVMNYMSDLYSEALKDSGRLIAPPDDSVVEYLRFPVLVPDKQSVLASAQAAGLEVTEGFMSPVHPYFGRELANVGYEAGCCPNAERLIQSLIFLPTSTRPNANKVEKLLGLVL